MRSAMGHKIVGRLRSENRVDVDALVRLLRLRDHRVISWPTCGDCVREVDCPLIKTRAIAEPLFGACCRWRGGPLEPGLARVSTTQIAETFWSRCETVRIAAYELRVDDGASA
jgi:hypothetical protein